MKLDNIIAVRTAKTIYKDGDKKIKVFNSDYSKADILNEALNQARVEETSLNIPKILEITKIEGKWAIISEYIEGKTLAQIMAEDKQNYEKHLERFIDIQLEMHSHKVPLLNKLKDKMSRKITETTLDATTRYDLHTRLESMPIGTKLCHGDFSPENIVITKDDKAYIIDWSHATMGNASADAARTYLLYWLAGDMQGGEAYLEMFCKKTDTPRQYVQKWIPIVAASQSVKERPEEREFLLHWVNVVDYQ